MGYAQDHIVKQSEVKAGDLPCQHPVMPPAPTACLPQRTNRQMASISSPGPAYRALRRSREENGKCFFFSCSSVQPKWNSASCRDPLVHKGIRKPQLSCRAKPSRCSQLGLARSPPLLTHPGFPHITWSLKQQYLSYMAWAQARPPRTHVCWNGDMAAILKIPADVLVQMREEWMQAAAARRPARAAAPCSHCTATCAQVPADRSSNFQYGYAEMTPLLLLGWTSVSSCFSIAVHSQEPANLLYILSNVWLWYRYLI